MSAFNASSLSPPLGPNVSGHVIIWDDGTLLFDESATADDENDVHQSSEGSRGGLSSLLSGVEAIAGQLVLLNGWAPGPEAVHEHLTNLSGLEKLRVSMCYNSHNLFP